MFSKSIAPDAELCLLESRHSEELYALIDANRQHLRPWMHWTDKTQSPDDVRTFIESGLKQFANNDGFHAGLWRQRRLIGVIGLHSIDWTHRNTTIGYWIEAASQGSGLMTSACRGVIAHIFTELKLHRVELRCDPDNQRSRAVAKRLGFTYEGTLQHVNFISGRFVDLEVYGLLEDKWRKQ